METAIENIVNTVYDHRFSVVDNLFSRIELEQLITRIKELENQQQFKKAGIGNKKQLTVNEEIRSDSIYWIDEQDTLLQPIFFNKINALMQQLNRRFFLGLNDYEFHFAVYKAGSFYKKHRDAFQSDDARKITVILYLNSNWTKNDGGELVLYLDNKDPLVIEPLLGRLLVFESELEHEVLTSHATRYSITGWIKNKSRLI